MNIQLASIWNRTLELIKDEVTEISFNTWIKSIEPLSISANSIELEVPTDFNKGILESRFLPLIRNTVKHVASRDFNINIIVQSQGNTKIDVKTQETEKDSSVLNPKYTFDTFVIGNSNRLAHAASVAVAETPARAYNPLFLYGGVGLGKTHLMHAIGHYILTQNPSSRVMYVTSEKFTNELINAIKDDRNEEFRSKYRNVDVLLIDDIQFIGGKERTQEEFFHTFNSLHGANKQIIISSDRSPKEITTLEERLRSRFEWGLTADISTPDIETRIAILRKKAQQEKYIVPDEVLELIADKVASNIRELEGALNKIMAFSTLTKSTVDIDLTMEALKEIISASNARVIDSNLIIDIVSRYFDLRPDEFKSKKRNRDIAFPRQIAMFLCRDLTGLSLPRIGDEFGGRDHTTVMHAIQKISDDVHSSPEVKRTIDELKRNILGK